MKIYIIILSLIGGVIVVGDDDYEYENWKFHFLPGSGMGLILAIALPLSTTYKNVYLAYSFEANYILPDNKTAYEYPPLIQRNFNRNLIYKIIENKMQTNGLPGKACLLRTICEGAKHTLKLGSGVLGDILHIIITPSTSINRDLNGDYEKAEAHGKKLGDCNIYNKNCTFSFLKLISWIGQTF